jgi:hypothetical protein
MKLIVAAALKLRRLLGPFSTDISFITLTRLSIIAVPLDPGFP